MANESKPEGNDARLQVTSQNTVFCLFSFFQFFYPSKISYASKLLLSDLTPRWTRHRTDFCVGFQTHHLYIFIPFFPFCHEYTDKSMAICRAKIFSYDLLLNPSPGLRYIVRKEKKNQQWGGVSLGDLSLSLSLKHCNWCCCDQGLVSRWGNYQVSHIEPPHLSTRSTTKGFSTQDALDVMLTPRFFTRQMQVATWAATHHKLPKRISSKRHLCKNDEFFGRKASKF